MELLPQVKLHLTVAPPILRLPTNKKSRDDNLLTRTPIIGESMSVPLAILNRTLDFQSIFVFYGERTHNDGLQKFHFQHFLETLVNPSPGLSGDHVHTCGCRRDIQCLGCSSETHIAVAVITAVVDLLHIIFQVDNLKKNIV